MKRKNSEKKIKLKVSHGQAPHYSQSNKPFSLARYFEKNFNVLLFVHTEAQLDCGVKITQAIKSFFKMYNIDEKHYSQEAALEVYLKMKARSCLSDS